jgi:DNA-binding transcriptional MerR regulator
MQQLDLFNKTSGKKEELSKPEKQQTKNAADDTLNTKDIPGEEGKPKQLIKPLSKNTEQKISKRGRKSFKEINLDVALLDIPDDEILFQKQYYSITEVSEWFHVNTSLIRFWENEFDILKPRKNRKGDRLFRPEDVKNLRIIYYLLRQQKYSIEGARQFLKDNKKKAEMQTQLVEALTRFRSFLLELRANLGA